MKAGKLIHTVSVQRLNAGAVNDFGTVAAQWEHVALMRAELVQLKGAEAITARGAADDQATVFRVRAKVAITTADRVVHRGKAYRIRELVELGRADGLELHCESFPEQSG